MKTQSNRTPVRTALATSASIALLAMVSSASAQGITQHSETVTLRSGNDASHAPLNPGDDDAHATFTWTTDPASAVSGAPAKVIVPHSAWMQSISDPDARWIHSDHQPGATNGTGTTSVDVLYAHTFELPVHMPQDATVTVDMIYCADDRLQSIAFGDTSGAQGITTPLTAGNSYASQKSVSLSNTAQALGLSGGTNVLYIQQLDIGGSYAGTIYSVDVTVEYCLIEAEFRSGMRYSSSAGWVPFGPGAVMPNLRAVTLPEVYNQADLNAAFSLLDSGGGDVAVAISPNAAWTSLSQGSGWINSSLPGLGGSHHRSVLYAIDFQLPATLPSNLIGTLDLEWAADDALSSTFMNDMNNPSLGLVAAGAGPNSYSAPSTSTVSGSVSSLNLQPGANTLYLLQEDVSNVLSGINYIAKLELTYPCDGVPGIEYESFCECVSDWGPCGNPGLAGQGCANSTGMGSTLSASGTINDITLHADQLPTSGMVGLFFKGQNVIGPLSFGDGLRCVGGDVLRLGVVIDNSGQADLHLQSNLPVGEPTAGFYQFWYRDNSGPCGSGFNLSSAIGLP